MSHPRAITDIDHVLTYVHDGEAAERFFRALGFVVSPVSHITQMGIVNRLVLFRNSSPGAANFIELMAVSDATKLPPRMAVLLQGTAGIKSIVLATTDAHKAHDHLTALGHPLDPPVHVRREWQLGDGTSVFPAFDVLLPVSAGLTFNACHYHTLDLYKRAEWTAHRNRVTGLVAVMAVAHEPRRIAAVFEQVLGVKASDADGCLSVRGDRVALDLYEPTEFAARYGAAPDPGPTGAVYAGYCLDTEDLDAVRHCAREAAIPLRDDGRHLSIAADIAPGRVIAFEAG